MRWYNVGALETPNPIGEIVESSTLTFVAQCLEVPRRAEPRLFDPPPFGSFVKVSRTASTPAVDASPELDTGDEVDPFASSAHSGAEQISLAPAVYALVYAAETTSIEPNRRPAALGYEDEDDLRRQQPQIFELLRTDFSGLMVAHSIGGDKGLRRYVPPTPPRIHARVYRCQPEEVRALTEDLSFLRSVLAPAGSAVVGLPADELASACLREARAVQHDDARYLLRAGKALAAILAEDYERLQAILRNVI
jgi:hypothetical protein